MTRLQFNTFVRQPDLLGSVQEADLQYSLTLYPYCQIAHLMYSKCLDASGNPQHHPESISYTSESALHKILSWQTISDHLSEQQEVSPESPEHTAMVAATAPEPEILAQEASLPEVTLITEEPKEEIPTELTTESFLPKEMVEEVSETITQEGEEELIITDAPLRFLLTDEAIEEAPESIIETPVLSFHEWLQKTKVQDESSITEPIRLDIGGSIVTAQPDELEKLYMENVYEIQLLEEKAIETAPSTYSIIDKFIKADPHIHVKKSEEQAVEVPVENKARHSGELDKTLITETLAEIFVRQKLYSEAISAYEKLSLKFPEKSAYFAARIEKLKSGNTSH